MSPPPLSDLGIRRIPVPVPFVEAGGPVNVYVIDEDGGGVALWDAGLGTEEAEKALREGFDGLRLSFKDVRRIFISHGHIDHFGAAELVRAETGAPIYLNAADVDKTRGVGRWSEREYPKYAAYMRRLGLGDQAMELLVRAHRKGAAMARPIENAQPLGEGDVLRFARFEARALHVPGHTPGQMVLHVESHRVLLSADHVLEKVSPNPLLELGPKGEEDKHKSLVTYLASSRRVRDLDVDWVLPGHDVPFQGHRRVLEGLFTFYARRQGKMLARLGQEPAHALDLASYLFPRATPRQLFLVLSEVVGNLEVLEEEGLVAREVRDGLYVWRAA